MPQIAITRWANVGLMMATSLGQRWQTTLAQRNFAHRPYVGPTGWAIVGPTRHSQLRLHTANILPTCLCVNWGWANVGPTWFCLLSRQFANILPTSLCGIFSVNSSKLLVLYLSHFKQVKGSVISAIKYWNLCWYIQCIFWLVVNYKNIKFMINFIPIQLYQQLLFSFLRKTFF